MIDDDTPRYILVGPPLFWHGYVMGGKYIVFTTAYYMNSMKVEYKALVKDCLNDFCSKMVPYSLVDYGISSTLPTMHSLLYDLLC